LPRHQRCRRGRGSSDSSGQSPSGRADQSEGQRQRPDHGQSEHDGQQAKLGKVADGRGRKTVLPKEKIDEIVDLTRKFHAGR